MRDGASDSEIKLPRKGKTGDETMMAATNYHFRELEKLAAIAARDGSVSRRIWKDVLLTLSGIKQTHSVVLERDSEGWFTHRTDGGGDHEVINMAADLDIVLPSVIDHRLAFVVAAAWHKTATIKG